IVIPGLYVLFVSKKKKKLKVNSQMAIVMILSSTLLLAGCSVPREINQHQHRAIPEAFPSEAAATTAQEDDAQAEEGLSPSDQAAQQAPRPLPTWKTYSDDPQLISVIGQAIINNPDMEMAIQQIEIAHANLRLKRSA